MIRFERAVERKRSPDDFNNDSWINSGEYIVDSDNVILIMKGSPYTFCGMKKINFTNLRKAGSKGKFYHKYLKGRYRCGFVIPTPDEPPANPGEQPVRRREELPEDNLVALLKRPGRTSIPAAIR